MVRLTHILITASRMIGHHSGELRRMMERFTDEEAIDRSVPFANDVMLVLVAGPGLGHRGWWPAKVYCVEWMENRYCCGLNVKH